MMEAKLPVGVEAPQKGGDHLSPETAVVFVGCGPLFRASASLTWRFVFPPYSKAETGRPFPKKKDEILEYF